MTLALTTSDNQNNTGFLATITGSDPTSTNTVYVAPVFAGNDPIAWTAATSLVGNGQVNVSVLSAYYYVYVAGTVSAQPAQTPPQIALASFNPYAQQTLVELAIHAKVQVLQFTMPSVNGNVQAGPPGFLPAARVYHFDTPMNDDLLALVALPCVLVCPTMVAETVKGVVNAREDVGWPVTVAILHNFAVRQQGIAPVIMKWREQIARAVRSQRLLSVPEVYKIDWQPQQILTWKPPEYQMTYSVQNFLATGRDYRGV